MTIMHCSYDNSRSTTHTVASIVRLGSLHLDPLPTHPKPNSPPSNAKADIVTCKRCVATPRNKSQRSRCIGSHGTCAAGMSPVGLCPTGA